MNTLNQKEKEIVHLYKNPNLPIEDRVKDLLSRMTIEEKFWQLFMIPGDLRKGKDKFKHGIFGLQISTEIDFESSDGGQILKYSEGMSAKDMAKEINELQKYFIEETRLGIPIIPFDEALHGLIRTGATSFPQAIGLAATWDREIVSKVASAIAIETKTRGIRDVLSPVINIARDVRWGRVEETYGEDPYLTSEIAIAFVKSFEDMNIITTPKHMSANLGDGGRDSYPVHFNERLMNEIYFPGFISCVQKGRTRSIMTSYNSFDGVPCSANKWLLKNNLKEKWKFDGFVISDASAVGGILDLHHTVNNYQESAKSAIEGGLDVIFQSHYDHHLIFMKAFTDGIINKSDIDDAVARVLKAKFQLGLFENPYVDPEEAEKWNGNASHRELALEAARKSIVLLKNDNNILPLTKDVKSLAVIGIEAVEARLGGYSGPGIKKINILEGIKNKLSNETKVLFAEGCGRINEEVITVPKEFLFTHDNKPGLQAEYFNNIDLSGVPALSRIDPKIEFGWTLFSPDPAINFDWFSVRWTGKIISPESGIYQIGIESDDGYRFYLNNELVIDNWVKQSFSLKTIPFKFEKSKAYNIRIEFYENQGNVKFRMVWNIGIQDKTKKINDAVQTAKECEIAIIVVGIEEGEFRDRANICLPGRQEEMIKKISETGKQIIVVIVGGSAVTMSNWIDKVPAIIDVWYPGEEGGNAVADVLFGDYNPAGRLPFTFPQYVNQLPLYYNHKPTGRGDDYYDMTGKPLFPFGHGLSFTTFEYSNIEINPPIIKSDENTIIKFKIQNKGSIAGEEVIQLYIKDLVASVARPVIELKGFKRINLNPEEIKEISFEITPDILKMPNEKMEIVVEPGDFKIMIGSSSRDIRIMGILKVSE